MNSVPSAVAKLFTPVVLAKLGKLERSPSSRYDSAGWPIRNRHLLLSEAEVTNPVARLRRDAWWRYIEYAECKDFLDTDLRMRLTSPDDAQFRGAMAECMSHWYFATQLNCALRRNPSTDGGADFIADDDMYIEVKAPYVPVTNKTWSGDDADELKKCVMKAGKQFKTGPTNVVVLVPLLRMPVYDHRDQLVTALVGEHAWRYAISIDSADSADDVTDVFIQKGKLAKLIRQPNGNVTTDLTRVSAVVTLETVVWPREEMKLDYEVRVVHNPSATSPLTADIFRAHPQLLSYDEGLGWSDKVGAVGEQMRTLGAS